MALHLTKNPDRAEPRGVVVMLHGGTQRSVRPVSGSSASWRRTSAMQRSLASEFRTADLSCWLPRYRQRGWNQGAPVADIRECLDLVGAAHPQVPIVILGHSMGARTAVHVADDPQVVGVVALAPWFSDSDPVEPLRGKRLVAAHGQRDRITSAVQTRAYVERARSVCEAEFIDMGNRGHYLLSGVVEWNSMAAESVLKFFA